MEDQRQRDNRRSGIGHEGGGERQAHDAPADVGRDSIIRPAVGEIVSFLGAPGGGQQNHVGGQLVDRDVVDLAVIIETGLKGFQVEPSQGTHFFQNMTSLGCMYLTINPMYRSGRLDREKLSALAVYDETEHFIHAHSEKPLTIKVNGFKGEGVVLINQE